ncbi:hypothetical protein HAD_10245 [Hyphomonas adhaerens MHS-3]|uniref:DUF4387 domain-containing protein n=1 Tax=Hyphomonas adhaerens MHS-3 TaxID=1280949 RepID=A0A069E6Z1_9PROT|nr:DUF4387 domain-containing protein [Hyphomonas adhaerens]KCZ86060.1 hypothetical protein HAD_10245 [Hyphomonas adhaerens MHS-3]
MSISRLGDLDVYIRSKNAGPFWVTIDIFCGSRETYHEIDASGVINATGIADLYGANSNLVRIFHVEDLNVLKISFPRPYPQGHARDRDQHSGQYFVRLLDLTLPGKQA